MLEEAGFRIDFTPIAWTYATGFPKASNIGKMVDKRLGKEREVIGIKKRGDVEESKKRGTTFTQADANKNNKDIFGYGEEEITSGPASDKAKELDGSYGGFQPKPAWENVIVCMKPLSEKGYLDQAMKDGKGITWLDGCRIPLKKTDYDKYVEKQKSFKGAKTIGVVNEGGNTFLGGDMKQLDPSETYQKPGKKKRVSAFGDSSQSETKDGRNLWGKKATKIVEVDDTRYKTTNRKPRPGDSTWAQSGFKSEDNDTAEASPMGRFPANLLVQDDVLNDGKITKSTGGRSGNLEGIGSNGIYGKYTGEVRDENPGKGDEGSFSRYYDLDAWWEERIKELPLNVQATYPFLIVPKASKAEKNKGCDGVEEKYVRRDDGQPYGMNTNKFRPDGSERKEVLPKKNNHPTVKPISLMSYLITLGSREDDLVLDPFVGSGTTCIAAKLLNRKYIGMEMDSDYVVIAQERIKAHEPEKQQHNFF
jgi:hypothetical protein